MASLLPKVNLLHVYVLQHGRNCDMGWTYLPEWNLPAFERDCWRSPFHNYLFKLFTTASTMCTGVPSVQFSVYPLWGKRVLALMRVKHPQHMRTGTFSSNLSYTATFAVTHGGFVTQQRTWNRPKVLEITL